MFEIGTFPFVLCHPVVKPEMMLCPSGSSSNIRHSKRSVYGHELRSTVAESGWTGILQHCSKQGTMQRPIAMSGGNSLAQTVIRLMMATLCMSFHRSTFICLTAESNRLMNFMGAGTTLSFKPGTTSSTCSLRRSSACTRTTQPYAGSRSFSGCGEPFVFVGSRSFVVSGWES